MQQIGYVLISSSGDQVKDFTQFPNPVQLSNGDDVYAASVGEILSDGSKLVNFYKIDDPPGEWYDVVEITRVYNGTDVIMTVVYSSEPDLNRMRASMSCSPFQGRMALSQNGLLTQVETYMADPNTPQETKIAWEYATVWNRTSPLIESLGTLLGLSPTQIDDLFELADTITV